MEETRGTEAALPSGGSPREVFRVFLLLGLTSFGGPVAHLGYFHETFVRRRRWLDEQAYADLVALCQFLPGPASSQVGMAIGLKRAGFAGMLAAWTAFTLPSALLMVAFAYGAGWIGASAGHGWIAGLKAAAVAIVAQAVLTMARQLAWGRARATIAALGMIMALSMPTALGQVLVIVLGGLLGLISLSVSGRNGASDLITSQTARTGQTAVLASLCLFFILLLGLPLVAAMTDNGLVHMFDSFYRAGSLVFGGGHVVLPLLQSEMVGTGLVDRQSFLAGYGAVQAVPGPLFSFAAYLGAIAREWPSGLFGAAVALIAIFLPSALLIIGVLPFWIRLRNMPRAGSALAGINAAVVGLLAAAFYNPVFLEGIPSAPAMAVAVAVFIGLLAWRIPPWAVVILAGLAGFLVL